MNINLSAILPDEMPDEMAYHLVEFFSELTFAIEEYYFASGRTHIKNKYSSKALDSFPQISDGEDPF